MNKTLSASLLAVSLLVGGIYAQDSTPANEKKVLTAKAFALFQKGKIDDAIEAAGKVVEIEKNSNQTDTASYASALVNLARMKRENFLVLQNKLKDDRTAAEKNEIRKKSLVNIKESEELFREALRLNESNGRAMSAQTADIKSDLAWTAMNYTPVAGGSPSVANSRARIDDAEKFFAESLALNERIRGRDADETLFVVLGMGNFYLKYDNFDKAFSFYERYIQTAEKTPGKNYPDLVNALRPFAKILIATFQDSEAADAVKRIEEITGKKEDAPKEDLSLHLRSKDSVAFNAPNFIASNEEMKKLRERLKIEGRTMNRNDLESIARLKRVFVKVTVDENGKIIEAAADTKNTKLREKAEREISQWTVRPFTYNGTPRKMRGYLFYTERD